VPFHYPAPDYFEQLLERTKGCAGSDA